MRQSRALTLAGRTLHPNQHVCAFFDSAEEESRVRLGVTRLWANMERCLEGAPGVCTYDLAKFSAAMVMDILRTHPMVIIGGIIQDNPFYVPPHLFMRELRDRQ